MYLQDCSGCWHHGELVEVEVGSSVLAASGCYRSLEEDPAEVVGCTALAFAAALQVAVEEVLLGPVPFLPPVVPQEPRSYAIDLHRADLRRTCFHCGFSVVVLVFWHLVLLLPLPHSDGGV